jgi:hypothetical protein
MGSLQIEQPTEEEVKDWAWHSNTATVDDEVLRLIGNRHISFTFTLHVPGCEVQEQCGLIADSAAKGGHAAASGRCASAPVWARLILCCVLRCVTLGRCNVLNNLTS